MYKIGFWIKDTGNFMTHAKGLTQEQIDFLKTLKLGDRLILWKNSRGSEVSPDYTLAKYLKGGE